MVVNGITWSLSLRERGENRTSEDDGIKDPLALPTKDFRCLIQHLADLVKSEGHSDLVHVYASSAGLYERQAHAHSMGSVGHGPPSSMCQ